MRTAIVYGSDHRLAQWAHSFSSLQAILCTIFAFSDTVSLPSWDFDVSKSKWSIRIMIGIVYCFKYTLRKNEFIHAFLSSSAMYEYHDNWMLWRDDIGLAECKSQHSKRYNYYNILQRIWRPSTYYSWGRMFIGSRIPLMRLQPKTGVPCCNIPAL